MANRPVGIAILSILLLVVSSLIVIAGVILAVSSGIISTVPGAAEEISRNFRLIPGMPPIRQIIAGEFIVLTIGLFLIITGIIATVIGWGLWTGGNWARWIAIIVFGLSALTSLINVLRLEIGSVVSLAIDGLVVYYLFMPHVKRFFKATV